ncbi:MAG TPA: hypothetical protein VND20_01485 [Candidatus Binataceae bacterium]|nr:hypothetical protein [Candidatus Binataceae bacterium]
MGKRSRHGARRSSDIGAAVLKIARLRYRLFHEKFGRDPGPDEPLFFDSSKGEPIVASADEMWRQVFDAAAATRTDFLSVMKFLGLA